MPNENTPKEQTVEARIDAAFQEVDKSEAKPEQQPGSGVPEQVAPEPKVEGVGDTLKTPSTPEEGFKGVDGGFQNHPAWVERENKLKQAREQSERFEKELERINAFLGDPDQLARMLEKQGYKLSKAEEAKEQNDLVSEIAKKRGWDLSNLDPSQKSYIQDIAELADLVAERRINQSLSKEIGPYKSHLEQMKQAEAAKSDMDSAVKLASKYGYDWDKDIKPHVLKELDTLDQKDPTGSKLKFNATEFVKDLLLQLQHEKASLQVRQEKRDVVKDTLKTITPAVNTQKAPTSEKFPSYARNPKEFDAKLDEAMASLGYRD